MQAIFSAPTALRRSSRYSYANNPAAGEPAAPLYVRDCRKPVPPALSVTLSDVSLTVTVQVGLKTQLIAGALTLTTLSGAAATTMGAKQSSKANENVFILGLPPKVGSAVGLFLTLSVLPSKSAAALLMPRWFCDFVPRIPRPAGALNPGPS